jgi:hypothetical protein
MAEISQTSNFIRLMTTSTSIARWVALACASSLPVFAAEDTVLFEENFEHGNLDQWVGDVHGPHDGAIVPDPLHARNHVLTFTALDANGNLFSAEPISLASAPRKYTLSFDYLGLGQEGSEPGNFGGFLGLAASVDDWETGRYWLAGTDPSGINTRGGIELIDDGAWHHYEIDLSSFLRQTSLGEVHVMVEDWRDIGGVPGDAYFDNIRLVATPRREPRLQLHVTEVTLCWESETNHTYQVQYRSVRTPDGWTNLDGPVDGNGGTNCVQDHLELGEPQRFYRITDVP